MHQITSEVGAFYLNYDGSIPASYLHCLYLHYYIVRSFNIWCMADFCHSLPRSTHLLWLLSWFLIASLNNDIFVYKCPPLQRTGIYLVDNEHQKDIGCYMVRTCLNLRISYIFTFISRSRNPPYKFTTVILLDTTYVQRLFTDQCWSHLSVWYTYKTTIRWLPGQPTSNLSLSSLRYTWMRPALSIVCSFSFKIFL